MLPNCRRIASDDMALYAGDRKVLQRSVPIGWNPHEPRGRSNPIGAATRGVGPNPLAREGAIGPWQQNWVTRAPGRRWLGRGGGAARG